MSIVVPSGSQDRRPGFDLRALYRRRMVGIARWLWVDPQQTLAFRPRKPGVAREDGLADMGEFHVSLDYWRRSLARGRAVVLVRRYVLLALILGFSGVLVNRLLVGTVLWETIAVPVGVLCCAGLLVLRRTVSLEATARHLDHALALHEQVASALEIEDGHARGTSGALHARLEQRARAILLDARRDWRVHRIPSGGEWLGIGIFVVAMLILVILPGRSTASTALARSHPATVTNMGVPVGATLSLPPIAARTRVTVQVRAAVVSRLATHTAPGSAAGAHSSSPLRTALTSRRNGAPPPPVGRHTTGAGGARTGSAGENGTRIPGVAGAVGVPAAHHAGSSPQGAAGTSLLIQKGNQQRILPAGNGKAPTTRRGAPSGNPSAPLPGATSASAGSARQNRHAGAGTGSGSHPAAGQPGGIPQGAQALPYGGGLHLTPSQLPKPGLIEGSGVFQGKGTPGGSGVGHEPGSTAAQPSIRPSIPQAKGRQFTLQSGYGGNPGTHAGRPAPGHSAASGGHVAATTASGQAGLQIIDYVPADGNVVASPDRSIITSYFVARAAHP